MTKKQTRKTRSKTSSKMTRSNWRLLPVILIGILAVVGLVGTGLGLFSSSDGYRAGAQHISDPDAPLARFYTQEVMYWQEDIYRWAETYRINPNAIAVLMQIESCGSPEVLSWVGAVGLMQVMPFYFDNGENMLDPDTNVYHGMRIFQECLNVFADGDVGIAAACYNGGASITQTSYVNWPQETQSYYDWANGLWNDVVNGVSDSDTLEDWLASGGSRLCAIAAEDLSTAADVPLAVVAYSEGGISARNPGLNSSYTVTGSLILVR